MTLGRYLGSAVALVLGFSAAGLGGLGAQAPQGVETFDAAWQLVRDSHFDKTLNGVNWDAVGAELRPRAVAARTPGELRSVLREMLGRLGQSHFTVLPASADSATDAVKDLGGTPGFDVRLVGGDFVVSQVDPQGGGAAAGVQAGWKLLAVDEMALAPLVQALPDTLEARLLHVEAWRLAHVRLHGPAGSRPAMLFEDGAGAAVRLTVERRHETGEPVTVGNLPTMYVRVRSDITATPGGRSVGVVGFNVWMTAVDPLFQQAVDRFRSRDGVIIDLRGNPGGLAGMLMGIAGHFIDERIPLGVMRTRESELQFVVNPRRVSARGERVQPFAGPLAILVDALSGSASECFAGGMQSLGRARIFGQPTMGQALPALFARLPNGDVLIHAFGDFVTSNGTRLEARGVIPDQAIPLDRRDLLAGRDATMEAAVAWFDTLAPGTGWQRR